MAKNMDVRQRNIDVVKRLFEEVYNQGNLDLIDELVSEDVVHDTKVSGYPIAALPQGREAFKELGMQMMETRPGMQFRIMEGFPVAVTDSQVANWWSGTYGDAENVTNDDSLRMSEIYTINDEGKISQIVYQGNVKEFSYGGGMDDDFDDEVDDERDL